MSRNILMTLVVLCLIAFSARIGLDVYEHAWRSPNAMEHRTIAQALVHGNGFTFGDWGYYGPTSVQSPPFPFLLAGMYKIFGSDTPADGSLHSGNLAYFAIMVLNALAGAGLVWTTYLMTRVIGGTPAAALVAAGLMTIWPSQVYAARTVQAISLITLCVTAMTILYYKSIRTGKAGPWIGYSVIAVLATLTEPVLLPALLISGALILICKSIPFQARLRNGIILGFTIVAVIGPWATRNYIVHGKMIPIKGTFWVNVWKGNNEYATGTDRLKMTDAQKRHSKKYANSLNDDDFGDTNHMYEMLDPSQRALLGNQPEAAREEIFKQFATTWISGHPARYAQLCGIRLFKTLTIDWDNPKSYSILYIISRAVLLLLTLGGLIVALKQRWSLFFPGLLVVTALATYTLTITAARFAIPFEAFQLALGGALLTSLAGKKAAVFDASSVRRGPEPVTTPGLSLQHPIEAQPR